MQVPFVITHSKEFIPIPNPVTPEFGLAGFVTVTGPATTAHAPVPNTAVLAANVAVVALHNVWSEPAFDVVAS